MATVPAKALTLLDRLHAEHRRFGRVRLVGLIVGVVWLGTAGAVAWSLPGWATGLLLGGTGLYAIFKALRWVQTRRRRTQLRLEGLFLQQPRCITLPHERNVPRAHLWCVSGIYQGRRAAYELAYHHRLDLADTTRQIDALFSRSLHPLHPVWRYADVGGAGLLLVLAVATLPITVPTVLLIAVGLIALGTDVVILRQQLRWQPLLHTLQHQLTRWTAADVLHWIGKQQRNKPYVHTLLYRAEPWARLLKVA